MIHSSRRLKRHLTSIHNAIGSRDACAAAAYSSINSLSAATAAAVPLTSSISATTHTRHRHYHRSPSSIAIGSRQSFAMMLSPSRRLHQCASQLVIESEREGKADNSINANETSEHPPQPVNGGTEPSAMHATLRDVRRRRESRGADHAGSIFPSLESCVTALRSYVSMYGSLPSDEQMQSDDLTYKGLFEHATGHVIERMVVHLMHQLGLDARQTLEYALWDGGISAPDSMPIGADPLTCPNVWLPFQVKTSSLAADRFPTLVRKWWRYEGGLLFLVVTTPGRRRMLLEVLVMNGDVKNAMNFDGMYFYALPVDRRLRIQHAYGYKEEGDGLNDEYLNLAGSNSTGASSTIPKLGTWPEMFANPSSSFHHDFSRYHLPISTDQERRMSVMRILQLIQTARREGKLKSFIQLQQDQHILCQPSGSASHDDLLTHPYYLHRVGELRLRLFLQYYCVPFEMTSPGPDADLLIGDDGQLRLACSIICRHQRTDRLVAMNFADHIQRLKQGKIDAVLIHGLTSDIHASSSTAPVSSREHVHKFAFVSRKSLHRLDLGMLSGEGEHADFTYPDQSSSIPFDALKGLPWIDVREFRTYASFCDHLRFVISKTCDDATVTSVSSLTNPSISRKSSLPSTHSNARLVPSAFIAALLSTPLNPPMTPEEVATRERDWCYRVQKESDVDRVRRKMNEERRAKQREIVWEGATRRDSDLENDGKLVG